MGILNKPNPLYKKDGILVTPFQGVTSSPPRTAGLVLHLDGEYSTITSTGLGVSEWADISGNSNHAIQNTDVDRPLATTVGAFNAIQFDAANTEWLDLTNNLTGGTYSVFAAVKIGLTASVRSITGDGFQVRFDSSERVRVVGTSTIGLADLPATSTGTIVVVGCAWNNTTQDWMIWNEGAKTSGNVAQSATTIVQIGRKGTAEYFDGDILNLLIYNAELSEAEGDALSNWLTNRYI